MQRTTFVVVTIATSIAALECSVDSCSVTQACSVRGPPGWGVWTADVHRLGGVCRTSFWWLLRNYHRGNHSNQCKIEDKARRPTLLDTVVSQRKLANQVDASPPAHTLTQCTHSVFAPGM